MPEILFSELQEISLYRPYIIEYQQRPARAAMKPSEDYYQLLGVERTTSVQNIRRAYRQLVHHYHPDLHPGDSAAEEQLKALNAAVAVLIDPVQRVRYDRNLRRQDPSDQGNSSRSRAGNDQRRDGHDVHYQVAITPEEADRGTQRTLSFYASDGQPYDIIVHIPAATTADMRLRVANQGGPGLHGGRRGDLYVVVIIGE